MTCTSRTNAGKSEARPNVFPSARSQQESPDAVRLRAVAIPKRTTPVTARRWTGSVEKTVAKGRNAVHVTTGVGDSALCVVLLHVAPEIIEDTNEVAIKIGGHKLAQLPRLVLGLGNDLRLPRLPLCEESG